MELAYSKKDRSVNEAMGDLICPEVLKALNLLTNDPLSKFHCVL